jgi:hypothetical protein
MRASLLLDTSALQQPQSTSRLFSNRPVLNGSQYQEEDSEDVCSEIVLG